MTLQIRPVLAALRRHRLATLLIVLEIALACAVLCNAFFLIATRLQETQLQSGVDEGSLAVLTLTGFDPARAVDLNARVVEGVQHIPGVQSVSTMNAVPFGRHAGTAGITTSPDQSHNAAVVHFYLGGPGSFEALGLHVVAGRAPRPTDQRAVDGFVPSDADVLVTRALATRLWPGADPLGKQFWTGKLHFRVIGVLDHLARPAGGQGDASTRDWSVFVPAVPGKNFAGVYLIRAAPAQLERVLRDARERMATVAPDAVVDSDQSQTLGELRERYFRSDRAMAGMLVGVIGALLLVTALGIVGLTSFWVAQRRKQIGVRRALGATRRDILQYFQTENLLIVSFGILVGMALAYALNLALMSRYELPRLPIHYLPVGAFALWLVGQLAVLAPALRAAAVPPVVATRSV